jgi:DNA-binding beta-propeller fold protein YncE
MIKRSAAIFAILALILQTTGTAFNLASLDQPESVVVDSKTGDCFISNVNGKPAEKDNNGYITKISKDGLVVVLKFIESNGIDIELHAPKGMAIEDGILFVADIDRVLGFDAGTGAIKASIDFGKFDPRFLNDIAGDDHGKIYVSDMSANRIYVIDMRNNNGLTIFKESVKLESPNGILYKPGSKSLIVASHQSGKLFEISRNGEIETLRLDMDKGLDGVTVDQKGTLYVSNFSRGEIYDISNWGRGELKLFQSGLTTPADIFFNKSKNEILVPQMSGNSMISLKVE